LTKVQEEIVKEGDDKKLEEDGVVVDNEGDAIA